MTISTLNTQRPSIVENIEIYGWIEMSAAEGGLIANSVIHDNADLRQAHRPTWMPAWAFRRVLALVTRAPDRPAAVTFK